MAAANNLIVQAKKPQATGLKTTENLLKWNLVKIPDPLIHTITINFICRSSGKIKFSKNYDSAVAVRCTTFRAATF